MSRIVDRRFQHRLLALMQERGVSARALAAHASVSPSYLSEIANGRKMPSEQVARALDTALDAGGKLVDLVAVAALTDDREPLADAANNPHRIGQPAIDALARVLSAQRHLEDFVGAAAVVGSVIPQMETVERMVGCTAGPLRPRLMYVAAQWAQYRGWLHTSLGEWPAAQAWNRTALEWAAEVDSPDLTATILSYQAHVSWLTLRPGPTIGLSRAALRGRDVYPGQRAYDYFQTAKALAYTGEAAEAERMLAAGEESAAEVDAWAGEVPPWQYYREPWLWQLEHGLVRLYLDRTQPGNAARAVEHLRAGLAGMPEHMRASDWAAEYQVYLADAYRRAGAADFARDAVAEARQVAEATSSRRVLSMVAGRERQLRDIA